MNFSSAFKLADSIKAKPTEPVAQVRIPLPIPRSDSPVSFKDAGETPLEPRGEVARTQLVEKYRPKKIEDFVGLERIRRVMRQLIACPFASSWLFVGASGTGKTTMAMAVAAELGAELIHIPSRECDLDTVRDTCEHCRCVPMFSKSGWYVVLVDEADHMTAAAQLAFLSKLDATAAPPKTIFIFTANEVSGLEDRFISRCRRLEFSTSDPAPVAVVRAMPLTIAVALVWLL